MAEPRPPTEPAPPELGDPGLDPDDELPIHPAVRHWLGWYAQAATESEREQIVLLMLRDLNARLLRAEGG